ncbi:MAG: hypothetical protein H6812_10655 [Phycisphaeraceae bacterium]|nr:hypothetical protein [Phycisphaerales bacterium]MCB9843706.1 hypothetical protein [Phycisphaeraceae bacterium]
MDTRTPHFDPTGIPFPSDAITLGQMRAREPDNFRPGNLDRIDAKGIDAIATHRWELRLAEKAFAEVLSLPNPLPYDDRRNIVEMLNRAYKLFGVSSGIQQTWQLVRSFEGAAAEQARQISGRSH